MAGETILVALKGRIQLTITDVSGEPYEVDVGRDVGPLAGTVTVVNGDPGIVGTGTSFLTDFVAGDTIETAGGQRNVIINVVDNLNMTASIDFTVDETDVAYTREAVGLYDGSTYRDEPNILPQKQTMNGADTFVLTNQDSALVEQRDDYNHIPPRVVPTKRTRTVFPRGDSIIRWVWTDLILGLGDAISSF